MSRGDRAGAAEALELRAWSGNVQELANVIERTYLARVLWSTNGRIVQAARRSRVHPRTLHRKTEPNDLRKKDLKPR